MHFTYKTRCRYSVHNIVYVLYTLEINNKDITGGRQIHTDNPAVLLITQMHTSRSSRTSGNILTNQNIRYQKLPESDLHDNRENAALSESQVG